MTTNSEDSAHPESLGALCTFLENDFVRLCLNVCLTLIQTTHIKNKCLRAHFYSTSHFCVLEEAYTLLTSLVSPQLVLLSMRF
ncbi:hypothetical protein L596_009787 [Steinernema carpocapsae]|uniref:Uncharacterized protein n=1 Tax=Steinernema carpocapsae TaxID=34508 RepID=A0A4U5PGC2_STECR|nr:hypothetical protein L596_009787 [Steinernema carpocapsae]